MIVTAGFIINKKKVLNNSIVGVYAVNVKVMPHETELKKLGLHIAAICL